jgi:hypothetical protein
MLGASLTFKPHRDASVHRVRAAFDFQQPVPVSSARVSAIRHPLPLPPHTVQFPLPPHFGHVELNVLTTIATLPVPLHFLQCPVPLQPLH